MLFKKNTKHFIYCFVIISIFLSFFNLNNRIICHAAAENTESYEFLKSSLKDVLNNKKFTDLTKEIFLDTFDAIYKNYYDYESTNLDIPKVHMYIKNNFIELLKDNVDYVNVYDRESEQGKSFLSKIGVAYYMPGLKYISIVPPAKKDIKDYNDYLAAVLHEVIHSNQENIAFSRDSFLGMVFTEGAATYNQRFAVKPNTNLFLYESIENPENKMAIYTKVPDELGYSFYENSFYKLQMLIGYNEMVGLQRGASKDHLILLIDNKYGKGKGEKILKHMEDSFIPLREPKDKRNTALRYNAAVELEKEILACIKKDMEDLKNKEDTIKYFNVYRNYKNRYLLSIVKSSDIKEDHTNEIFDLDSLDNLMMKKTMEFKALSIYVDKEMEKNVIKMLLYSDSYRLNKNINIPYNLKASKFACEYDSNHHNLILFDLDNNSVKFSIGRCGKIKLMENKKEYKIKKNIFAYITSRTNYINLPDTREKKF